MGSTVFPAASGSVVGKTLRQQIFNSSGTWTYPTSSNFDGTVEVVAVGGGGSGGNFITPSGVGTTSYGCTGGGGGGQVTKKTISVLNLGNQNVIVGAGGSGLEGTAAMSSAGLCGGFSSFGTATITNAYPDPDTRWGLVYYPNTVSEFPEYFNNGNSTITNGNMISSTAVSVSPTVGSYMTRLNLSASGADTIFSDYFNVDASTSHNIGFSYSRYGANTGAQNITCTVHWYKSTGQFISSSTVTTYTAPVSGTTWTSTYGTLTTPALAAMGRLSWTSTNAVAASHNLTNIFVVKASLGITTCTWGYSTNSQWLGAVYKSPTVLQAADSVIAQGGGGGWGIFYNSNTTSYYVLPPQVGYTTGGDALSNAGTPSTSLMAFGGAGGGAASSAEPPSLFSSYSTTVSYGITLTTNSRTNDSQLGGATTFTWPKIAPTGGGRGALAASLSASSANLWWQLRSMGANGKGINIDGKYYGNGGIGGFSTVSNPNVTVNFDAFGGITIPYTGNNVAANDPLFDAAPNTGNGGNGFFYTLNGLSTSRRGGNGGSGTVIVKWYE